MIQSKKKDVTIDDLDIKKQLKPNTFENLDEMGKYLIKYILSVLYNLYYVIQFTWGQKKCELEC